MAGRSLIALFIILLQGLINLILSVLLISMMTHVFISVRSELGLIELSITFSISPIISVCIQFLLIMIVCSPLVLSKIIVILRYWFLFIVVSIFILIKLVILVLIERMSIKLCLISKV